MNFLAHLFLAEDTADSMIGNLAGDFVKGRLKEDLPPAIADGIRQHRRVDAFTDAHPEVAGLRRVLLADHGHWSRVIGDVFLDHFLACSFHDFAGEALEAFAARVHERLDRRLADLPGRLRLVYPAMRDGQWLVSYRSVEGIHAALTNMSRRITRHPDLAAATVHLYGPSRAELARRFRAFMPDVIRFARSGRT